MAVEFLRLGSSIPGAYWGNCCACLIQNFKTSPSAKYAIQISNGDAGMPVTGPDGFMFAGTTEKDMFLHRLRFGTFSTSDMPNHVFIACLTGSQISGGVGKEWLAILKEQGFEFFFASDNSVYSGAALIGEKKTKTPQGQGAHGSHANYYFILRRNIGTGACTDPLSPPSQWTALPDPYAGCENEADHQQVQLRMYNALPKKFYSEKELKAAGLTDDNIHYAGLRSENPQEPKKVRDARVKAKEAAKAAATQAKPTAPFGAKAKAHAA